jgi:predicted O-methyltransferase YrrM
LERGRIVLSDFLGHWGNVSIEELCKIALIAAYYKPKNIFEFGTYNGMTTLQLALNTPPTTHIHTLDISPEMAQRTRFKLTELDRRVAAQFRERFHTGVGSYFKGSTAARKITQHLCDSASFDYSPFYGKMDMIFIDAAHDYENKKCDSENSLKMIAPGGIILWDNYDDVLNPEVTRYLAELALELPLHHLRGTPLVAYLHKYPMGS